MKEVFVTPLEIWKFSMRQRANNWTIEMSQRVDNRTCDIVRIWLFYYLNFAMNCDELIFFMYL